jgi:ABC-type lipoprotein export system ATPase subunit
MNHAEIEEITILPGRKKNGEAEDFGSIIITLGETISIVGPTGSGKSAFINDIEMFAQNDTVTGRTILVNGEHPPEEYVRDPSMKPIASITQNTQCLADLLVKNFLEMHARARKMDDCDVIQKTIDLANEFTGEKILPNMKVTELSGGQTKALMIADATLISDTPIILLDEIENAGIFKDRVIECVKKFRKAVVFVTHDPLIALLSDKRIVMKNGAVEKVLAPKEEEKPILERIMRMDKRMDVIREKIRQGESICD